MPHVDAARTCQLHLPAGAHCNHWENGDGDCCGCGRPSWLPAGALADIHRVERVEAVDEHHANSRTCAWRLP